MSSPTDGAWLRGFCTALAEVHRQLLGGFGKSEIVATCKAAGVHIADLTAAECHEGDVEELRKAGVPAQKGGETP